MSKSNLIVVNPISGDINKTPIVDTIQRTIFECKEEISIFYTTGKKDADTIKNILDTSPVDRVITVGGDGTISMVGKLLMNRNIPVGIIPAGSANGLAVNFGIPELVEHQLEIALSDSIMDIDVLFLNGHFSLHIADLGLNAELIRNYDRASRRGKLGYFLQSIPTLIQSNFPFEFKIESMGEVFQATGALLAIANASKFGTGATINPVGKMNDGIVEILIFKNLNLIEIAKTAQENPDLSPDFVKIITTNKATITTEKEISFQIDGEYMGEVKKVEVELIPRCLKIAVPPSFLESSTP